MRLATFLHWLTFILSDKGDSGLRSTLLGIGGSVASTINGLTGIPSFLAILGCMASVYFIFGSKMKV